MVQLRSWEPAAVILYSKTGADGETRTPDMLFTNQDLRRPPRIDKC